MGAQQRKQKNDDKQSVTMLAAAVKIQVLNQRIHPKHRLCS